MSKPEDRREIERSEIISLQLLFGLFGFGALAVAQRNPDLEHNLHLVNGAFGSLISLGAIGGLIGMILMGQWIHRIGVFKAIFAAATVFYGGLALVPHLHNIWLYTLCNIIISFAFATFHIANHTQVLRRQEETGRNLLPLMGAGWSIGVLSVTSVAALLTPLLSFAVHIDLIMLAMWFATMVVIIRLRSGLVAAAPEAVERVKLNWSDFKYNFTFDKSANVAFILGVMMEVAAGDWGTLVTNQEIKQPENLAVLSYLALVLGMIIGRLGQPKALRIFSERSLLRICAIGGGSLFILLTQSAFYIAKRDAAAGLAMEIIAFFVGGIGTSVIAPLFINVAVRRSKEKASVIIARMGVTQTILFMALKNVLSQIVSHTSITNALIMPGLMLISTAAFGRLVRGARLKAASSVSES
jgi:MFS family permease